MAVISGLGEVQVNAAFFRRFDYSSALVYSWLLFVGFSFTSESSLPWEIKDRIGRIWKLLETGRIGADSPGLRGWVKPPF